MSTNGAAANGVATGAAANEVATGAPKVVATGAPNGVATGAAANGVAANWERTPGLAEARAKVARVTMTCKL